MKNRKIKKQNLIALLASVLVMGVFWLAAFIFSGGDESALEQGGGLLDLLQPMELTYGPDWAKVDLLPVNDYSRPGTKLRRVNGVVVHYIGNPGTTARQNRNYFENLATTHETYASSHFIIGLEGEVIQCVPLNEIAYCSNERNNDTISIECCHPDDTGKFTDATVESLTALVRWLSEAYSLEEDDIIRHYDVSGKECPRYYVRNPEAWDELLTGFFKTE